MIHVLLSNTSPELRAIQEQAKKLPSSPLHPNTSLFCSQDLLQRNSGAHPGLPHGSMSIVIGKNIWVLQNFSPMTWVLLWCVFPTSKQNHWTVRLLSLKASIVFKRSSRILYTNETEISCDLFSADWCEPTPISGLFACISEM